MAQPQWQQVAAPDVSGAANGFAQFSKLFGGGLDNLKDAASSFDGSKSSFINNQLALALAQQPNTDATKAAVASGNVGGIDLTNPDTIRRLSSTNLQAISPETMIKQATDKVNLDKLNNIYSQNQAQDALSPQIASALLKRQSFDPSIRAQGETELAGLNYKGVGSDFVGHLAQDAQNTERGAITNDSSQFNLSKDQTAYTEGRHASDAAERIARAAVNTGDIDNQITNYRDPTTGQPLNASEAGMARGKALEIMRAASASGPGGVGGTGGGGFNGPSVSDPGSVSGGYGTFVGNAKFDKPANEYTIGELQDKVQPTLIAGNKGKFGDPNTGSSAVGMYQITSDTLKQFAPQVLGSNWRDYSFTPMVQEAISNKIYDSTRDAKGNIDPKALMGRWASLSKEQADQIATQNLPWSQARGIIAKGETGTDPLQLAAQGAAVDTGVKNTLMQTLANSGMAGFQTASGDMSDLQTVAGNLKKSTFTAPNVDAGQLEMQLSKIRAEGRNQGVDISPAMAGEILKNSTGGQGSLHRLFDAIPLVGGADSSNLGNGQTVSNAKVSDYVNQLKTGKLHQDMATFATLQAAQGPLMIADKLYNDALGQYNDALQKAKTKEGLSPQILEQYRQKFVQAGLDREQAQLSTSRAIPKGMMGTGGYQSPTDKSKVQAALDQAQIAKTSGPNFLGAY